MKTNVRTFLPALMASSLLLAACGGSSGGDSLIDPADQPEDLAKVLGVSVNGVEATVLNNKMTPIPAASNDANAPSVVLPGDDVSANNNEEKKVDIQINSDAQPSSMFAKIVGADTYAQIALDSGQSKATTNFSFSIRLPDNLRDGRFCIEVKVQDSNGLVSADSQSVCYVVQSDRDDENSADQVRSQLQGSWVSPCETFGNTSFLYSLIFDGNNITDREEEFDNGSCSGSPVETFDDPGTYVLGNELTTDGGLVARAIDVQFQGGEVVIQQIVRVNGNQLLFGIDQAVGRPTQLNFDETLSRSNGSNNPGTPDNTALGDQTWRFVTTIQGTFNGQPVNQTAGETEVSGLQVPQDSSASELQSEDLSEAYAQGLQQACDNGFVENSPTRFDNFSYTTNGDGGIGTIIEGGVELFVDGTCRSSNGDTPLMIDATIGYRAERLS